MPEAKSPLWGPIVWATLAAVAVVVSLGVSVANREPLGRALGLAAARAVMAPLYAVYWVALAGVWCLEVLEDFPEVAGRVVGAAVELIDKDTKRITGKGSGDPES